MRVRDAAEALLTAVLDYVVCTCHLCHDFDCVITLNIKEQRENKQKI